MNCPARTLICSAALAAVVLAAVPRPAAACSVPGGSSKPINVARLPAGTISQGSIEGLTLVGHVQVPHSVDEATSDVWKLGSTVLLGYRCGGDGSAIVDVSDPARPAVVARTPPLPNLFTDDVSAVRLEGDDWSGDVFIEPFDNCGGSGTPARIRFWDISNPATPELIGELMTHSGVHNVWPVVRPDGAFLMMALPRGDTATQGVRAGFAVADFTDPRRPRIVGLYNLRSELGDVPGTDFLHDIWVDEAGTTVYAAWWDAGLIRLDITNPRQPRLIGQTAYYGDQEWYGRAAGNTHQAVPSKNGRFVYLLDEDFSLSRDRVTASGRDPLDPPPHPSLADERLGPDQASDVWGFTRVLDLQAPGGPQLVAAITTTNTARFPPRDSGLYSVHNGFEWEGRLFLSHYSDGVRVLDVSSPSEPREVGHFVPPDLPDRRGRPMKTLVWGVHVEDGLVYASDMAHGLWVLAVDGTLPTETPTAIESPAPTPSDEPTPTSGAPESSSTPPPTPEPTFTETPTPTDLPPTAPFTATSTVSPTSSPTSSATPMPTADAPETSLPPVGPIQPPLTELFLPISLSHKHQTQRGAQVPRFAARQQPSARQASPTSALQAPRLEVEDGTQVVLAGAHAFDEVIVRSGGVLRAEPYAGPGSSGGTLDISARRITVELGGRLSADGSGFRGRIEANGEGPGGGEGGVAGLLSVPAHFTGAGAGGGYGGRAGDGMYDLPRGQWRGGSIYGTADGIDAPWGSAGGAPPRSHHEIESIPGGNGGGALILRADQVTIDGTVSADGDAGQHGEYDSAGGGSGGTIVIEAGSLTVSGLISASGGRGGRGYEIGGAGGGGRIKVYHRRGSTAGGSLSVAPGQGPCPGDAPSPYACAGTINMEKWPDPATLYLPIALPHACIARTPLAVVLVVDASQSMDRVGSHGTSPLQRALSAADAILSGLPNSERAGVVEFSSGARELAPLTTPASARSSLQHVTPGGGSRIDLGIDAGVRLLTAAYPASAKVLVLLSDGVLAADEPVDLDGSVAHAQSMGIVRFAIGFGDPAHRPSLETVAGTADRVWMEPSAAQIANVVDALNSGSTCPVLLHDAQ